VRRLGEPPPRALLPDKKILRFSRLVDSVIKKQAMIRTLPPPTTSGLKLEGFLYTPVCNARSEWHSIAHVRQTIVPFMRFRTLGSLHFDPVEILAVYSLRILGGKEPEG